jgi:ankyrin repeat protein
VYTPEVVSLLLQNGADVNAKDVTGRTALISAATGFGPNLEVVFLLLENGADVNAKNNDGKTALECASDPRVISLIKLYEEK